MPNIWNTRWNHTMETSGRRQYWLPCGTTHHGRNCWILCNVSIMHTCLCTHTYTDMFVHTYIYRHVCAHIHTPTCLCTHTYTDTFVHTCIYCISSKSSAPLINHLTPFTELWKIVSNFRKRSSHVYTINGSKMCVQLECGIVASKNWAKLKYNYLFCAEFLEELWCIYFQQDSLIFP